MSCSISNLKAIVGDANHIPTMQIFHWNSQKHSVKIF